MAARKPRGGVLPTPPAPAPAVHYLVLVTLGGGPTWEAGQDVTAAELRAIPGCEIARLVAIGALRPIEDPHEL